MSKVPCGGFKLDENFFGINENDELSLTGGSEGEGAPYQQLVTDGDGTARWEDRTHWVEQSVAELIPEQTLSGGMSMGSSYMFPVSYFTIIPNLEYTVVFDGVEYKCISAKLGDFTYIGNATLLGASVEDTKEPFLIAPIEGMSVITATDGPHTISLSGLTVEYHQLPLDYITNGFALSGMIEHNSETMTDAEFNAYSNVMRKAFHPILKWIIDKYGTTFFIDRLSSGSSNGKEYIDISLLNGEEYTIFKNSDGVYDSKDASSGRLNLGGLLFGSIETHKATHSNAELSFQSLKPITVSPYTQYVESNATEMSLFKVEKDGPTKGQDFEVLGNGTVKAYSVILPSTTEGSTKKFKITVDDSGTISATEVTS